ncbi:RecQ family ATP-dependent DNA helicase [Thiohalomonas denitrificans]|uniref:ATP-dependent DNA helicase RecQ n=1 Tax=Thiohalomonas denitrificans TaxID=415747 RepID=A0A1G5Q914_9GAMM|nr:ATP-dependent DNA helicase RecQ [Thiohalomonas denitrificans]SCZ57749.1 ATP-dependent DNA helicase RecQ [Thiohalomonas denitrificans]
MPERIQATLKQYFGYDELLPGQLEVMQHLLAGKSTAAVFPTGGGKSLCYQLPALLLPGVTVVVSPLIALMKDQIDALTARGIAARRLDSTLSADEYRTVMEQLRDGTLRMLYVAPERFNNERFREAISRVRVSLFAVDEAHCLSEWGHNFRPDYLKLAGFARDIESERVLALTATATPPVLEDICRIFAIAPECAVRTGFYRPNLQLITTPVSPGQRDSLLLKELESHPPGATIVYVTLQKSAEAVADKLAAAGWPARAYHAGMKDEQRTAVQEWFMASDDAVVVATIAFGMGVDKADIRYVYHYNPPKSLENYAQEIGRAGRDGQPSRCHLLFCRDDLNVLENFIYGDTPEENSLQGLIQELFTGEPEFDLALHELSARHDIRPLVLRTLLTYLELDGLLEGGTPFYSEYKFKPLLSSGEILSRFEGERKTFLEGVFRQAKKGRSWLGLDPGVAANALHCPRDRVIRALDWLGEQGMLEVKAAGVRHRYRRLQTPDDRDALATSLHQRLLKREQAEMGRLRQVLDLAALQDCRSAALAAHFGETLKAPCGHCSGCGGEASRLPEAQKVVIPSGLTDKLAPLLAEKGDVLASPRTIARFLCGVSSPRLSRAKLSGHALFGALAEVPFGQVMSWAQSLETAPAELDALE